MAKITISVPDELFSAVERRRLADDQTRSEFFRRAAEACLRREVEREAVDRYVRSYEKSPEAAGDAAAAHATAVAVLAEEPWD